MKKPRFGKEEEGAVGIGTLIVFIAMVLVAAIAAAVLINTSGALQDRAKKTGAEATQDVSGGIKVQHVEGLVNATGGTISDFRVYLALHAGTDGIDIMDELEIHMTWVDNEATGAVGGTADLVEANNSAVAGGLTVNSFWAEAIVDPHGSFSNSQVLDQDSIVVVHITAWELQQAPASAALGADNGLDQSSDGTLKFIISSGMTPTIEGFNIPGSFPAGGGWVEFY